MYKCRLRNTRYHDVFVVVQGDKCKIYSRQCRQTYRSSSSNDLAYSVCAWRVILGVVVRFGTCSKFYIPSTNTNALPTFKLHILHFHWIQFVNCHTYCHSQPYCTDFTGCQLYAVAGAWESSEKRLLALSRLSVCLSANTSVHPPALLHETARFRLVGFS
jgi:hypothetical protein